MTACFGNLHDPRDLRPRCLTREMGDKGASEFVGIDRRDARRQRWRGIVEVAVPFAVSLWIASRPD
jgi:hypothetical protein